MSRAGRVQPPIRYRDSGPQAETCLPTRPPMSLSVSSLPHFRGPDGRAVRHDHRSCRRGFATFDDLSVDCQARIQSARGSGVLPPIASDPFAVRLRSFSSPRRFSQLRRHIARVAYCWGLTVSATSVRHQLQSSHTDAVKDASRFVRWRGGSHTCASRPTAPRIAGLEFHREP